MNKKLLVIDGNALIHRAFHAYPAFSTHDGIPTNALYGFAALLQRAVQIFIPDYVIVCFDTPAPTFRKELSKDYQINRPELAIQLVGQFPLVRQFLNAAHICHLEKPGFEADDLIGTIAKHKETKNINVFILTGDKDILQLVDEHVTVISPRKGLDDVIIYNSEKVKERFGINPDQIPDLKALMGDSSDNYPGVAGIGPKTAATLIQKFDRIENIYKNIENIENKKTQELLLTYKDNCLLSLQLARIVTNVDFGFSLNDCLFTTYDEDLKDFFEEFEFKTLSKRFFPIVSKATIKKAEAKKAFEEKTTNKKTSDQMDLF